MFFPNNAENSTEFSNIPIPGTNYLKYQNSIKKESKTPSSQRPAKWANPRLVSDTLEPAGERKPKLYE